jgi:hypothetical protein
LSARRAVIEHLKRIIGSSEKWIALNAAPPKKVVTACGSFIGKEGVAQAEAAARFKVNQARTHLQNNVVWVNIVLNFTILF